MAEFPIPMKKRSESWESGGAAFGATLV